MEDTLFEINQTGLSPMWYGRRPYSMAQESHVVIGGKSRQRILTRGWGVLSCKLDRRSLSSMYQSRRLIRCLPTRNRVRGESHRVVVNHEVEDKLPLGTCADAASLIRAIFAVYQILPRPSRGVSK